MKYLFAAVVAVALLSALAAPASACWCRPACCVHHVCYVEKTVVVHKPVYKTEAKEITVTVLKPRYETVEKDVQVTTYKTVYKDVECERKVPEIVWKEETQQRTVCDVVYKDVEKSCVVRHVDWKEEKRVGTCLKTVYKEEEREHVYTVCKLVPETTVKKVCVAKTVPGCGCCCKAVCYEHVEVPCTVYKPVYEKRVEKCKVLVPQCVEEKFEYVVKVPVCRDEVKKYTVKVPEYVRRVEEYKVKVPVCTWRTEKYVVKVAECVPVVETRKVQYQVCHYDRVEEKRIVHVTTCSYEPCHVKTCVPVCVPCCK